MTENVTTIGESEIMNWISDDINANPWTTNGLQWGTLGQNLGKLSSKNQQNIQQLWIKK